MKHSIKGLVVMVLLGGVFALAWYYYQDFLYQGQQPTQGTIILNEMEEEGVPGFEMSDVYGERFRLSDFENKLVILNFWASWCAPCVEEFPSMYALLDKFPDDLVLIAVSADYNLDDLNAFLDAFGGVKKNMIVSWDKDQIIAKKYGTQVLPESYIIGPKRELIRKISGVEDWNSAQAHNFFQSLIKEKL